jgi:hypothetical protein
MPRLDTPSPAANNTYYDLFTRSKQNPALPRHATPSHATPSHARPSHAPPRHAANNTYYDLFTRNVKPRRTLPCRDTPYPAAPSRTLPQLLRNLAAQLNHFQHCVILHYVASSSHQADDLDRKTYCLHVLICGSVLFCCRAHSITS